jgi:hypothetical protein
MFCMKHLCIPALRTSAVLVLLAATAALLPCSRAEAVDDSLGRVWADFGLGYGHMQASSGAGASGGSGVWVDAQLGARINPQWLVGLDIGGLGLHSTRSNYDSDYPYSSVYGESITNIFLAIQYHPDPYRGWFLGAGAGQILYGNKVLEDASHRIRSGNGHGGLARVGYDWPTSGRFHLEAVLSCEYGTVSANAPVSGHTNFSIVAASFHVAYH